MAAPVGIGLASGDDRRLARALGRPATALPALADWREAPQASLDALITHLSDRTAGRAVALRSLSEIRHHLLGDPATDRVLRAGDFLFNAGGRSARNLRYPVLRRACGLSDDGLPWLPRLLANSRRISETLSRPGRRVSFLVVPTKPVLYHDRLPPAVPPGLRAACAAAAGPGSALTRWASTLTAEGVAARHPLAEMAALRDTPHYHPPENFHSEGAAALTAARALLAAIAPDRLGPPPPLSAAPRRSDLSGLMGMTLDITLRVPDHGDGAPTRHPRAERAVAGRLPGLSGPFAVRVWRSAGPHARGRALVIANSFGLYIPQHLAPAFAETVAVMALDAPDAAIEALLGPVLDAEPVDEIVVLLHDGAATRRGLSRIAAALPPG